MLKLTIEGQELFDDKTQTFLMSDSHTIELEHSLVSLSKWEAKFEKPFLGPEQKTSEETLWYINAMLLSPEVPSEVFQNLTSAHIQKVNEYIEAKMSATWFGEAQKKKAGREVITAELIYYWMAELKIDLEWEHRHLNRLFTMIRVANEKNTPPKQMSKADLARRNQMLNEKRKAELKTKG